MLQLTKAAIEAVRAAAEESDAREMSLRIAAKVNQDGSIEYGMGFDEPREDDVRVRCAEDVEVVLDPQSAELVEDAEMDYVEFEPGQFRFIFLNPLDPHYVPPTRDRKRPG